MAALPEYLNKIEREAVYRIREIFAQGKEASVVVSETATEVLLNRRAEVALYPEKPLLSFIEDSMEEESEHAWCPKQRDDEFFCIAEKLKTKPYVRRLITCGGVDDGKSTLIGKILFDTKNKDEQDLIRNNPVYLRKDQTIDYALLAGATEEETRQGITVQVSYSVFDWKSCSFLMADVPGHEEYTRNMAYAASKSDTAIIMIGANKGIVPQTRRHTRICYFMGIRNMIFAVNKMDMVGFEESSFEQLSQEVDQMMEIYPQCSYDIVPVAAKSGVNITEPAKEVSWYKKGSLLDLLEQTKEKVEQETSDLDENFCMPVQRICKSSQVKGDIVKKRVIQGEVISGELSIGDEIFVYPTAKTAKVSKIYCLNQSVQTVEKGSPIGIEFDKELDVARGYILAKDDVLISTDRMEVDLLWTSDNRLTQGKRYQVKIGTNTVTAVVTKICYQVDVNTGEHRYAEHLNKNALARCELCFSKQVAVTTEKESRSLGTIQLIEREIASLAAYGNIVQTISEDAWKEDGREVTASERESALGQKAGMIWFSSNDKTKEHMNYVERYLLRMGFHTIQVTPDDTNANEVMQIKRLLDAGLIVLLQIDSERTDMIENLLEEKDRIFDCRKKAKEVKDFAIVLKKMKEWASELI